jgi:hypothetical protein
MPHTIQYNAVVQIIEIRVDGIVKPDEFKEIFSQGVQLAKEKNCFLFLNDYREATLEMSTMDLYALPAILSEIAASQGVHADRLKRAIVVRSTDVQDAGFAEDVSVNRGQHTKTFLEIDEARKWLLRDRRNDLQRRPHA